MRPWPSSRQGCLPPSVCGAGPWPGLEMDAAGEHEALDPACSLAAGWAARWGNAVGSLSGLSVSRVLRRGVSRVPGTQSPHTFQISKPQKKKHGSESCWWMPCGPLSPLRRSAGPNLLSPSPWARWIIAEVTRGGQCPPRPGPGTEAAWCFVGPMLDVFSSPVPPVPWAAGHPQCWCETSTEHGAPWAPPQALARQALWWRRAWGPFLILTLPGLWAAVTTRRMASLAEGQDMATVPSACHPGTRGAAGRKPLLRAAPPRGGPGLEVPADPWGQPRFSVLVSPKATSSGDRLLGGLGPANQRPLPARAASPWGTTQEAGALDPCCLSSPLLPADTGPP